MAALAVAVVMLFPAGICVGQEAVGPGSLWDRFPVTVVTTPAPSVAAPSPTPAPATPEPPAAPADPGGGPNGEMIALVLGGGLLALLAMAAVPALARRREADGIPRFEVTAARTQHAASRGRAKARRQLRGGVPGALQALVRRHAVEIVVACIGVAIGLVMMAGVLAILG